MVKGGIITSKRVVDAMNSVDRALYLEHADYTGDICKAYLDAPVDIGFGATISAPHMVDSHRYLIIALTKCRYT